MSNNHNFLHLILGAAIFSLTNFAFATADTSNTDLMPAYSSSDFAKAQNVIKTNLACQASFEPVSSNDITLEMFGIKDSFSPIKFINIWAIWCAPCRAELPILLQLKSDLLADFYFINLGDEEKSIAQYAEQLDTDISAINTPAPANILDTIGAKGLPYNALFYQDKMIALRNNAIHDAESLKSCLVALAESAH